MECPDCKKDKDFEKEIFWCPRIRNMLEGEKGYIHSAFYGKYVCIDCCRENFFKNIYSINSSGGFAVGSCHDCDFPIGAILRAREWYEDPQDCDKFVIKTKINDNVRFVPHNRYGVGFQTLYWGYEWDDRANALKLVPKITYGDGVHDIVLRDGKLPKRIIITSEDMATQLPLRWSDFRKYYWVEQKDSHAQHFNEEEWMGSSPVVLIPAYYGRGKLELEKRIQILIEGLVKDYNDYKPKGKKKKNKPRKRMTGKAISKKKKGAE